MAHLTDDEDLKRREDWFDEAVNLDDIDLTGPEYLLALLYEDWLHGSALIVFRSEYLDILLEAGIIDAEIKRLCLHIAEKAELLSEQPWVPAEEIKGDSRWQDIFALCIQVGTLKRRLDR